MGTLWIDMYIISEKKGHKIAIKPINGGEIITDPKSIHKLYRILRKK